MKLPIKIIAALSLALMCSISAFGMSCESVLAGQETSENLTISVIKKDMELGRRAYPDIVGHLNTHFRDAFFTAVALGGSAKDTHQRLLEALKSSRVPTYGNAMQSAFFIAVALKIKPEEALNRITGARYRKPREQSEMNLGYYTAAALGFDSETALDKVLNVSVPTAFGKDYSNAVYLGLAFGRERSEVDSALEQALANRRDVPPSMLAAYYLAAVFL